MKATQSIVRRIAASVFLVSLGFTPHTRAESATKPNIVFILADDLGWQDVGCCGSTFHKTPNIDALAKRGMFFTQAYAANPLCSPTRASILTGQYPARIGITAPVCHVQEVKLKASIQPRAAATFIRMNRARPFYLNYWAFSVHAPYDAKELLVEKYRRAMDENAPQRNPLYAAMVQSLDDAVGTLVKTLEEEKLLDRTLVVFFSDNGGVNWQALKREGRGGPDDLAKPFAQIPPTSNAPLRGGKASVFEGGVREPCIVVWPGVVKPDTRSDAMIQSIDFLPTLAEAAGANLPSAQKLDGRSFLRVLRGEVTTHRDTIFTFFPHNTPASAQVPACAVRRGDWKLIRYLHDGPKQEHRHELYNLQDDLGETNNLAPAQPARAKELDALVEGFLTDTAALVPGSNPAWNADGK